MGDGNRWLVTGAAGFIGMNLCRHLLRQGFQVVGLDDLSSGFRENLQRIEAVGAGRFSFLEGDIRDQEVVRRAVAGCGRVVHLAAQVSVPASFEDPLLTSDVNITGFVNVFNAAGQAGAHCFVYASSCALYGDSPNLPLGEEEPPRPKSPYAVSKWADEQMAGCLCALYPGMGVYGLRFFNIFGPWQDQSGGYAAVIPKWLGLCLAGKRPALFGDGTASRDFCHVDNVCALIGALAEREGGPHIYNVGTGVRTSLLELFSVMAEVLAERGVLLPFTEPERRPPRRGDILHSGGDVRKAARELSFQPQVSLKEGMAALLAEEYGL